MPGTPNPKNPKATDQALEPGGYHSRGTPGEEGEVRRVMRVLKIASDRVIDKAPPVTGGGGAESTSAGRLQEEVGRVEGGREVYVLARKGEEVLETPVFGAADGEAVAVFSTREQALSYVQTADWGETHEPASLSPSALGQWLRQARREGIRLVAVDPGRQEQVRGDRQSVLFLDALAEPSDDDLYREIWDLRHR